MGKIRVKHFGPIKLGLESNDGFIDIQKVSVFIGDQGAGKSSVAKLISTFTWLEKALYRGDLTEMEVSHKNKFEKTYCDYHRLKNYFTSETELEYRGDIYTFEYCKGRLTVIPQQAKSNYSMPKIMYVPAERNFLSTVNKPEKIKGFPLPLYTFLEEYDKAQQELTENVGIPFGNVKFQYQKQHKISYVVGPDYRIRLLEASSGLQSAVPLFLVSRHLSRSISNSPDYTKKQISIEEEKRIRAEVRRIFENSKLSEDVKKAALEELSSRYVAGCFINIVEEIEQNLYPKSQKEMLFKLLEFANEIKENGLILTTHSPYIVSYLTLVAKAYELRSKMLHTGAANGSALFKLEDIIPLNAQISPDDIAIYEIKDGSIHKLPTYDNLPSDDNFLNQMLAESNYLFDKLLEIEEEL